MRQCLQTTPKSLIKSRFVHDETNLWLHKISSDVTVEESDFAKDDYYCRILDKLTVPAMTMKVSRAVKKGKAKAKLFIM